MGRVVGGSRNCVVKFAKFVFLHLLRRLRHDSLDGIAVGGGFDGIGHFLSAFNASLLRAQTDGRLNFGNRFPLLSNNSLNFRRCWHK